MKQENPTEVGRFSGDWKKLNPRQKKCTQRQPCLESFNRPCGGHYSEERRGRVVPMKPVERYGLFVFDYHLLEESSPKSTPLWRKVTATLKTPQVVKIPCTTQRVGLTRHDTPRDRKPNHGGPWTLDTNSRKHDKVHGLETCIHDRRVCPMKKGRPQDACARYDARSTQRDKNKIK